MFRSLDYYVSQVRLGREYVLNHLITFRKDRSGVLQMSFRNREVNQIYREIRRTSQVQNLEARFLEILMEGLRAMSPSLGPAKMAADLSSYIQERLIS